MDFNKLENKFKLIKENKLTKIEYSENGNKITLEADNYEYFVKIEVAGGGILQFKHCLVDALLERIASFYLNGQEGDI